MNELTIIKEEIREINPPVCDWVEIDGIKYSREEVEKLVTADPYHFLRNKSHIHIDD